MIHRTNERDHHPPRLAQRRSREFIRSKLIAEKYRARTVVVVSSDFHTKRVQHIFDRVFRGYELTYSGAKTSFSKDRYRSLKEHEKRELDRLRSKGLPGLQP